MGLALRSHQVAIAAHALRTPRCNVWAGMGTGKTAALLATIEALSCVDDGPVLVLAPLRVARSVWPDEAAKWHYSPVFAAVGPERFSSTWGTAKVTTVNYDVLPQLVEACGDKWPWRMVIADESTRLKSFRLRQGGKRAQALAKLAHSKIERWVNLTGTPAPNGLLDLWGQAWFIDQGKRLGRSYSAFLARWFEGKTDHPGGFVRMVPRSGAHEQIYEALADVTITVDAKHYFDLPPLIENVIEVELPSAARKHYRRMERELFTELVNGTAMAANAAAKSIKCLQCASGAMYLDESRDHEVVHNAKIDALRSVVEEAAGAPILVAYHFVPDRERILKAFSGAEALGDDPETLKRWNAGLIPMLVVHPQSAGHGLNLQDGGNIIVFFTLWWTLEAHDQVIERIGPTRQAQSGHNRPVFVHYLCARNTVDEDVLARIRTKADTQQLLLAGMAKRNAA